MIFATRPIRTLNTRGIYPPTTKALYPHSLLSSHSSSLPPLFPVLPSPTLPLPPVVKWPLETRQGIGGGGAFLTPHAVGFYLRVIALRMAPAKIDFYVFLVFKARCYAERGIAKASCLSVCLSVCNVDHWNSANSAKIISRLINLTFPLSLSLSLSLSLCKPQHDGSTAKGTPQILAELECVSAIGKIVDFRHLSRRISETVQDKVQVTIDY